MHVAVKGAIAAALVAGSLAVGSGAAFADTPADTKSYTQDTATGFCEAILYQQPAGGNYVQAAFINDDSGFSCKFWLTRSYDGSSYSPIGSYGSTPDWVYDTGLYNQVTTGTYWDGAGYLVEACFELHDASTGWT